MQEFDRICISRMKYIGDVVLTTSIVRAVREKYPDAFIAYLGEKEAVSLLEHNPNLDEIVPFDFTRPAIFEQSRVMIQLRRMRFDVFVDLFCNPRTAMLAYASGAPMRIGKEVRGRGRLYTHRIRDDGKPKTAIEFHYQYVKPLSVEPTSVRTEIFLTDDEKREAQTFLTRHGIDLDRTIVGLHPGATWPSKMWDLEKFAQLADLVRARLGAQVVITQGPDDRELVGKISRLTKYNPIVLNVLPLRQLAAVLSCFNVYITNDCGPMHIAVAVGTTTICIFGPGEENIWFPYASPHVALRKDVPCHPCHLDFCNRTGGDYMECMKQLSVEEVFSEVRRRLEV